MWASIMNFLGGPLTGWVEGHQSRKYMKEEGRLELKKAEIAFKVAEFTSKSERLMKNDLVDAEYDMQAQRERRYTIADELLIICVIILVGAHFFFPATLAAGWLDMGYAGAPWWLEFIIVGIFISVFGLMRLFRAWSPFNKSKSKEK